MDLKKQLRKANKEVDTLKNGVQNPYSKEINNTAYGMSATECRRILQSVSNVVFADRVDRPDVTRLPQMVQNLREQVRKT